MWKTFPFYSIVFLSALQGVPEDLLEAATVDGAGPIQRFRAVTLPSIKPTLYLLSLLAFIFAFRQFSMIYLTTGGGPERDTETLVVSVYTRPSSITTMRFHLQLVQLGWQLPWQ